MEIRVREATLDDLESVNDLTDAMHNSLADLYGLKLSDEELEEEHFCKGELEYTYVAELPGEGVVGYLSFSKGENEWVGPHYSVDHLSIHENYFGQGIAKKLFDRLLERARTEGMNIATGTLERNQRALEFYKSLGFRPFNVQLLLDLQRRLFKD